MGLFAPRGIPILFAVLALSAIAYLVRNPPPPGIWRTRSGMLILAFCAWIMLSPLWSISPEQSFKSSLTLLPLFIAGYCLVIAAPRLLSDQWSRFERYLIWSMAIGVILLYGETFLDFPVSNAIRTYLKHRPRSVASDAIVSRGMAVIALLLWPAAYLIWRRGKPYAALALSALAILPIALSDNEAGLFATGMGAIACLIAYYFKRAGSVVIAVVTATGLLIAPMVFLSMPDARTISKTVPGLGYNVYPRLFIWQSTAKIIREAPLFGHGYRSSRAFSSERKRQSVRIGPLDENAVMVEPIPLHPHNGPLQLWLELGLVGLTLAILLLLSIIQTIQRTAADNAQRAAMYGLFASLLTIASLSFGLWQGWWQCLIWIMAAIAAVIIKAPKQTGIA